MPSVRDFGARGDGRTDDTAALTRAVRTGDGRLSFPRGEYRLTQPLVVPLDAVGPVSLEGQGGTARLVMAGPGPALHLLGTHGKTALPADFAPGVWQRERGPRLDDLEIVGAHPEADGVRLEGTMQATLRGVSIRRCRHGVHLVRRNRNLIVADCHIYDNSGVGIFYDRVNLHQSNIHGCHVSYCREAGVKIAGGDVRNVQIVGNDIEYNYADTGQDAADVVFDARQGTIREATIVGNTIQAKRSRGGANVRLLGVGRDERQAVGLLTISGNLIASQETALHLSACRGVVVTGNSIYGGYAHAMLVEDAENLVIGANSLDHNPDYAGPSTDRVIFRRCRNVTVTGLVLQHTKPAEEEPDASILVEGCENLSLTGCQVIGARRRGVLVRGSRVVRVADCTVRPRAGDDGYRAAVMVEGDSRLVLAASNFLAPGPDGGLVLPAGSGTAAGNVMLPEE